MEKQNLISIIVPVHNVEDYLRQCISSICQQTYTNLEIILVDDESTDSSGKICDEFAEKDSRIQVLHASYGGPGGARNKGLRIATGDLIGFVDSDDWIEPEMYEYMCKEMEEHQVDLVVCSYYRGNEEKKTQNKSYDKPLLCDKRQALHMLVEDNILQNYVWDKLYKKRLFNNLAFDEACHYEDWRLVYKLIARTDNILISNKPFYNYRAHSGSIMSNSHRISSNWDYLRAVQEEMEFMMKENIDDAELFYLKKSISALKHLTLASANATTIAAKAQYLSSKISFSVKLKHPSATLRLWMMGHACRFYQKVYQLSKWILKPQLMRSLQPAS